MKKILLSLITLMFVASTNAINFTETFSANPLTNGWQIFGDSNLFNWNATNQNLAVTWDSSQSNSYFYHQLGVMLDTNSSFAFSFDLKLNDATIQGGTFQLAAGLLNFNEATNSGFLRGTGYNSTDEVEFDYFMDPMYGNSIAATEIDGNGLFADAYDDVSFDTNTTYHISVMHFAGDQLVSSQVTLSNQVYSSLPSTYIESGFGNFNVDTLAIMSYDATGSYNDDGGVGGVSLLAHGTIANFSFTTAPNPVGDFAGRFVGQTWQAQFQSYPNWIYILERSTNFNSWTPVSAAINGTGGTITLQDTNLPSKQAFYRVHAQR